MALITDISCRLPRPDIGELQTAIATELSKRLLGGAPVLPMSTEDVLAFVMAGAVNTMHGFVTQALKENNPATMCCDNLVVYGAQHGISLHAATRSKGYVAITGTPGAVIPANIRFAGDAREYKLDPGVAFNPTTIDSTGRAVLRVVSVTGGAAFDMPAGTELVVSTTYPGIDIDAIVVGNGLVGGSDNESCDSLRSRIVAAERASAISTNLKWYLETTSTYPGVTRACVEECEGCCDPQMVSIYPFMEGAFGDRDNAPYGVPTCEVIDAMNLWMWGRNAGKGEGLAPVGIVGRYYQALPTMVTVVAHCFQGCPIDARERMLEALRAFVRGVYCVGSKICKEHMRAVAMDASGTANCFADVTLEFDDSLRREDNAWAFLDCAHFLVVEDVELRESTFAPAPPVPLLLTSRRQ